MTMREFYTNVLAMTNDEEMTAIANKQIAQLDKRAAKPRTASKSQLKNEADREILLAWLVEVDKAVTIADIKEGCEHFANDSTQRVSALLAPLAKEGGAVVRTKEGKNTYFCAK